MTLRGEVRGDHEWRMGSLLVDEGVDYYPEGIFGVVFRNLGV